jgi:hypothetical protein
MKTDGIFNYIRDGKLSEEQFIVNFDFLMNINRVISFSPLYGYETLLQMLETYCTWFQPKNRSDTIKLFLEFNKDQL